jgi:hypothetical protein
MEIPYIITEWIWKKTPILNKFSDDTKAIISYTAFSCAIMFGLFYYTGGLYLL